MLFFKKIKRSKLTLTRIVDRSEKTKEVKEPPVKEKKVLIKKEKTEWVDLNSEDHYNNNIIGEIQISEKQWIVISLCRCGDLGLPHADIRIFSGVNKKPTVKGLEIPLNELDNLIGYLVQVENIADEKDLYSEYDDED